MKKFTLSDDRIVIVKKLEGCLTVIVKQKDSDDKFAEFTRNRCVVLIVLLLLFFLAHWYFIPRGIEIKQGDEVSGMVTLRTQKLKMSWPGILS